MGRVIAVLVGLVAFCVVVVVVFAVPTGLILVEDPVSTTARITTVDPMNHGRIDYTYQVNKTSYTGRNGAGDQGPNPFTANSGDEVTVTYSRSHPEVSCLCSPRTDIPLALGRVFLVIVAVPGLVLVVLVSRYRRHRLR